MQRSEFRRRMNRPQERLIVAPLALDPLSAALAKSIGFDDVYLGGGGLGYLRCVSEALLTATEVAEAARAICERVDVNVIVDGTTGFGDAVHAARTIRMVEQAGAAAIEIEDQLAPKRAHHHKGIDHMIPKEDMVGKIRASLDARTDPDFLIIARCNALTHDGLDDALERIDAYTEAGADMLMLTGRSDDDFWAVSRGTRIPLVTMGLPGNTRAEDELLRAGYALHVDAASGTILCYEALKRGYEGIKAGRGIGVSREQASAVMHEVATTAGMEALYAIEAATTERALYSTPTA